jgi:hypothetical protein
MDDRQFDGLTKRLSIGQMQRREALKALAGGALGIALGRATIDAADARKGKHKKKCVKSFKTCPADPLECCSQACCLQQGEPDGGAQACRPKNSVCCKADVGGGSCQAKFPTCCAPTAKYPGGFCAKADQVCCTDAAGGSCPSDAPTCCPPTASEPDGTCCSGENCCAASVTSARAQPSSKKSRQRGVRRQ